MASVTSSYLMMALNNNYDLGDYAEKPQRYDAFSLPANEFIRMFRLNKTLVRQLCNDLSPDLYSSVVRENVFSVETKVLTALRFFAAGSYQQAVANDYLARMSQASASRCIRSVSDAICNRLLQSWISFPDTIEEQQKIKQGFYEISRFPGVLGAIDCTHVALYGVSSRHFEEHNFLNRKNFHSINVQIICDADLRILNLDARFPGATHDSYIWRSSLMHQKFSSRTLAADGNSWLLGDSGYGLQPWLLMPIQHAPRGTPESRYNRAHILARNAVERCNGVLKSRFRCLLKKRALHYDPVTASKIINACAVLHNMCISYNVPLIEFLDVNSEDDMFNSGVDMSTIRNSQSLRSALVSARFS